MSKRCWKVVIGGCCIAVVMSVCGAALATQTHMVYRTAITAEPPSIDPIDVRNVFAVHVGSQVLEGLVKLDDQQNIIPAAAQRWEILDHGRVQIFHLRRGVAFHNGQEVTANDVIYSLTRLIRADDQHLFLRSFGNIVGAELFKAGNTPTVAGLTALDRYTVSIALREPDPTFYQLLATPNCAIIPAGSARRRGTTRHYPVSLGPFKVAAWDKGKQITLARHEQYYGKPAKIDQLIFYILPDDAIMRAFDEGRIEDTFALSMYHDVTTHNVAQYVVREKLPLLYFLAMNIRQHPFHDRHFRLALHHAINRRQLLAEIFPGEMPATSNIPYGIGGYSADAPRYDYDPQQAKRLVQQAAIRPEDRKIVIWARTSIPNKDRFKELIEANLTDVGIDAEVQFLSSTDFFRRFYAGDLGMFYAGHNVNLNDARYVLSWYESRTSQSFTGMQNAQFDLLLAMAREEPDDYLRARIFRKADQLLSEEAVQIVLYNKILRTYVSKRVRHFVVSAIGPTVRYDQVEVTL